MGELTVHERELLDTERAWPAPCREKDRALDRLGLTDTRYHQQLNALIDRPEALAYDGPLINRLARLRETRHDAREARRSA